MTDNTIQDDLLFESLMDVLGQVKAALKSGEIEALEKLSKTQDGLQNRLTDSHEDMRLTEIQIRKLSLAATHNQRLLRAGMAGIRSAVRRKSEIRDTRLTAQTYDRKGSRIHLIPQSVTREKRS